MTRRFAILACLLIGLSPEVVTVRPATAAGGLTWTWHNPLPQGSTLNAVSCNATGGCVAVGAGEAALTSADGGVTWVVQAGTGMASPRALACPTPAFCVAVGTKGVIRTSTNGGRTWHRQHSGTSKELEGVSCASASACVAAGLDGALLVTADGGASWSARSISRPT
jgi:photosystem II stability/assembly factor-like uncharacterized protein